MDRSEVSTAESRFRPRRDAILSVWVASEWFTGRLELLLADIEAAGLASLLDDGRLDAGALADAAALSSREYERLSNAVGCLLVHGSVCPPPSCRGGDREPCEGTTVDLGLYLSEEEFAERDDWECVPDAESSSSRAGPEAESSSGAGPKAGSSSGAGAGPKAGSSSGAEAGPKAGSSSGAEAKAGSSV